MKLILYEGILDVSVTMKDEAGGSTLYIVSACIILSVFRFYP
jgi:hypothetical protein